MQSQLSICLLGYSGHGLVVAEALKLLGYQDLNYAEPTEISRNPFQLNYVGFEANPEFPWKEFDVFALGVGGNHLRQKIAQKVRMQGKPLITVIHPQAFVAEQVKIGDGAFIARGACINPLASIGEGTIINTSAVVEHECSIHEYAHIAPSATLAGNVTVNTAAFVGANAVIKQGINIGKNALVGAGAVVINHIPDNTTVAGVPAKPIQNE